jgi:nitrate reductase NapE component
MIFFLKKYTGYILNRAELSIWPINIVLLFGEFVFFWMYYIVFI